MGKQLLALRRLIEDGHVFDGETIGVIAFGDMHPDRPALYASAADRRAARDPVLLLPPKLANPKLHEKYVLVEGSFERGAIGDVVRLELWSDPRQARLRVGPLPPVDAALSVLRPIATPDEFDGKRVRVVGFASMSFEGKALYGSEEAYRNGVTKDGLWLDCEMDPKLHESYVVVEGIFDASMMGHMAMSSGAIREITSMEPLRAAPPPIDLPILDDDGWIPPSIDMPGMRPR